MADGFETFGEVLGGGIDREGAFQEGLLTGAKTQDALAKARIRVDQARQRLEIEQTAIDAGVPPAQAKFISNTVRSGGGNVNVAAQALGQFQETGVRSQIADLSTDLGLGDINRLLASQATGPINLQQFGPGGELSAALFGPEAGDIGITPTGTAQISADEELAALREERRLNPERFRNVTNISLPSAKTLSEELLGEEGGISVIPEDFDAEEAFGLESFVTGGINAVTDFVGVGNVFEAAAQANEVIGNLEVRTKLTMLAIQQGSNRTSKVLLDLMGTYAEKPRSLFRGDDQAVLRLQNTIAALRREFERTKQKIDSSTKKTPTRQGDLEDKLLALADIVADYEQVLASIARGDSETVLAVGSGEVDDEGFTKTAGGSRFREIKPEN